jgi:hypothetical protein
VSLEEYVKYAKFFAMERVDMKEWVEGDGITIW